MCFDNSMYSCVPFSGTRAGNMLYRLNGKNYSKVETEKIILIHLRFQIYFRQLRRKQNGYGPTVAPQKSFILKKY